MKIFDYEEVKMNWDSFAYPIAVGTPVSVDGVLADNSSAHGLIARTVFAKPDGGDTLKIMTGGFIDMEEIVAGYGQELSSAAVQALCGIHFYKDGVCIPTGGSGGGGSDDQKWHETTSDVLFSETVTTVAEGTTNVATLSYAEAITADTLKVTFNGVEYTCTKRAIEDSDIIEYGASLNLETDEYDFSEYPFSIISSNMGGDNEIATETAGTYTVSASTESTTYTESFIKGVNTVAGWKEETSTPLFSETVTTVAGEFGNTANLSYADPITAETLTVMFDGTEYVCPLIEAYGERYYGGFDGEAPDFSEYPFFIVSAGTPNVNTIVTSAPGEHTVSAVAGITTYTETFIDGVKKNSAFIVHFSSDVEGISADKTVQEIAVAFNNGYSIIGMFANHSGYNEIYYLQDIYIETGAVSFVSFVITLNGTVTSASIKWIKSDPEDVNSFITGDTSLS